MAIRLFPSLESHGAGDHESFTLHELGSVHGLPASTVGETARTTKRLTWALSVPAVANTSAESRDGSAVTTFISLQTRLRAI